jgi:alkylated DNA repair dioxygenase AlkB
MADDIALPVPGLRYLPDYLDGAAHDGLLATVDSLEWHQTGDGRRLQFYGYWYHHTKGMYRVGDLPGWASSLASRLHRDGLTTEVADQVIVNDYMPGQGIRPHTDLEVFAEEIVSVTLCSPCVMDFIHADDGQRSLFLHAGSALVMSGAARHEWQHAIAARRMDEWQGRRIERSRRVSLTFRKYRPPFTDRS